MSDAEPEHTAFCNLCEPPAIMPADRLIDHLRLMHAYEMQPATWPDGSLVIVDTTLEPDDFAESGP